MITHRRSTKMAAPEPPIRFYRTIAISFLLITLALLGVIIFFTSKKATILVMANDGAKQVAFNLEVGGGRLEGDSGNRMSGLVTTTLFSWTEKYYPTGTKAISGTAGGEVVIYNKSNTSQPLVKTTRLLTPNGVLFRLSDRVMAPANGQVVAEVYADQSGSASDIGPSRFSIPGLSQDRQKFVYAESAKTMSGGERKVGVLTEQDIKTAQADYVNKVRQAALAAASSSQIWANQKVVNVLGVSSYADRQAGDEVSEFTMAGTSTVVAVFYNQEEMNELISKEIDSKIDQGLERVLVSDSEPRVSIVSYDSRKGLAQLSITQDVLTTIEANAEKLADNNFYGKTKSEIERYVLGLSRVSGVEVKFSPRWMRTAPSVPERIKVVVKYMR